jgi:predicted  nucleic acid-binding Zn-ribbon protein
VQVGGSIINDHPDLQQKVDNLEIDEATAIEVARARNLQNRANRDNQRQVEKAQSAQQSQQLINNAVDQVVKMEQTWRNTDPDFLAVLPELQESIAEIREKMHPSQWPVAIEMQYKAIKKAMAGAAVNTRQATPLRGNGHMSGNRQPANMQEAALQEMGMDF